MKPTAYTAADFIAADIHITELHNIYHFLSAKWAIPDKVVREREGLVFMRRGSIEYYFGNQTFEAHPDMVVCLPAGIPYNGRRLDSGPLEFYCIDFSVAAAGEYDKFPLPYAFTPRDTAAVLAQFQRIEELWQSALFCAHPDSKARLSLLLSTLAKDYATNACHYDNGSKILHYCDYLDSNYSRSELKIAEVASKFHLSETHLRRVFAKELGVSPSDYLTKLRLEHATRLLVTRRDLSVGQIAAECGFSSVYYFSTAFRARLGCSPSEYRAKHGVV